MGRMKIVFRKILSQIVQFLIVIIGITLLTFSIMYLSPKNPAELWLAGSDGNVGIISEEAIEKQEKIMEAAVSDKAIRIPAAVKDRLRAGILREMLLALLSEEE